MRTEDVQVPAGRFTAARIEQLGPDGRVVTTAWYAPGVGLVRRLSVETQAVEELERFWIPPAR